MARTEVAVNDLTYNSGKILTKTLIGQLTGTNGYSIKTLGRGTDLRMIFSNDGTVTGAAGPRLLSGGYDPLNPQSYLDLPVIGCGSAIAVVVDNARFRTTDAMIDIDSSISGTMYAFQ